MAKKKDVAADAVVKIGLFDFINSINGKTPILWNEESEAAYNAFMLNRSFSNHPDSVLLASEMNIYPNLDKRMQYEFYYLMLPKKKRYGGWEKAEKESMDEECLMSILGISRMQCGQMIKTLDVVNPSWREEAYARLERGGKQKERK